MILRLVTLSLLVLYPFAWSAPLMRAGLLPLFGLSEISVITGLSSLWETDILLALVVALFALVAPMVKTLGLVAVQWQLLPAARTGAALQVLHVLGRFAMADIFLIALYVTLAKGVGMVRIETAWGLYLFTACILASLVLSPLTERRLQAASPRA